MTIMDATQEAALQEAAFFEDAARAKAERNIARQRIKKQFMEKVEELNSEERYYDQKVATFKEVQARILNGTAFPEDTAIVLNHPKILESIKNRIIQLTAELTSLKEAHQAAGRAPRRALKTLGNQENIEPPINQVPAIKQIETETKKTFSPR